MAKLVQVRVDRSRALVGSAIQRADSPWLRMRGLLGRAGLDAGTGMRFEPASSLHMWFMRFPIDVIYVDRDERVVKLVSELKPWRVSAARGAKIAYEVPAGTIAETDITVGDQLTLEAATQPTEVAA